MLQCLLPGEIPLLFSTFDDDVLKRRFSMFPKAFGHIKITFGKLLLLTFTVHCIKHCSLLLFVVLFTLNCAYLRGVVPNVLVRFFLVVLLRELSLRTILLLVSLSLREFLVSYYLTIL